MNIKQVKEKYTLQSLLSMLGQSRWPKKVKGMTFGITQHSELKKRIPAFDAALWVISIEFLDLADKKI